KVSLRLAGGCATTAPSAGSVRTSAACAKAAGAYARQSAKTIKPARMRIAPRRLRPLVPLCRSALWRTARRTGHQHQRRRRLAGFGAAMAGGARRRNLDPAVHALLALLHGREIARLARLHVVG